MTNLFVSPIDRFREQVDAHPQKILFRQPVAGSIRTISWEEANEQVSAMASYLSKFPKGSKIAILSLNCDYWILADLAILMAGMVSVPIYPTANKQTIAEIVAHSGASLLFIGKLMPGTELPELDDSLEKIAMFQPHSDLQKWQDIIDVERENGKSFSPNNATEKDLATIVYTSGTTGHCKGVMLSYRNIFSSYNAIHELVPNEDEQFFSYLPLAHIAERMAVEMNVIYRGGTISFVESLDTFAKNLSDTNPTIFFGVPRIWVKLMQGIQHKLGGAKLSHWLLNLPIIGTHLREKIILKMGFSQVKYALSAAAPIPPKVIHWFKFLGLPILELYGLSETTGASNVNYPDNIKIGSVGKIIPTCEMKINPNGEVLLKGPIIMDGYYHDEDLTDAVLKDGWFYTGDIGEIDDEGYLSITGRVKEIFKTAKGKYISPAPIENQLQPLLGLEQLIVTGSTLPQPVVIGVLLNEARFNNKKDTEKQFLKILSDINNRLEKHERLTHIIITNKEWNVERGLVTPTLKLRRPPIEKMYQDTLDHIKKDKKIVWVKI